MVSVFFFQAEDVIRDGTVTGVQTCALPISSPASRRAGSGGTTTDSPVASTAAPGVASGSPARSGVGCVARAFLSACRSPLKSISDLSAVSQRPSFVMPMGTTSYFVLSTAFTTEAADSNDTSCSPLRPPKRMPTRSFAIPFQFGCVRVPRQSQDGYPKDHASERLQESFPTSPLVELTSVRGAFSLAGQRGRAAR